MNSYTCVAIDPSNSDIHKAVKTQAISSPGLRALLCLVASPFWIGGCMPNGFLITPVRTNRKLVETTLRSEAWLAPKIAVIDVDGILANAASSSLLGSGEQPVSLLLEKLDKARNDHRVKAVILRINSPGGTVAASELMHAEIMHFRESTSKPVVAVMMDVAASGGYYIACACDEIVAHRSTVTGSIGVVMQLFDVTGTMRKIGVKPTTIKSGELKAGGSPFHTLSETDRAVFQSIIDEMHQRFVEVVAMGRPKLTAERIRQLADGRVYTAGQALEVGLVDSIGTMRTTVEAVKKRIGAKHIRLVSYHRPMGYVPNYYARAATAPNVVHIDLPPWLRSAGARFMYLWAP